jgi:hypothetical protein
VGVDVGVWVAVGVVITVGVGVRVAVGLVEVGVEVGIGGNIVLGASKPRANTRIINIEIIVICFKCEVRILSPLIILCTSHISLKSY